eukprot:407384-Hanusia_phi.AAC.1
MTYRTARDQTTTSSISMHCPLLPLEPFKELLAPSYHSNHHNSRTMLPLCLMTRASVLRRPSPLAPTLLHIIETATAPANAGAEQGRTR